MTDIGFDIGDSIQGKAKVRVLQSSANQNERTPRISSIRDIALKFVAVEKDLSSWLSRFTLWMPTPSCWENDRFAQILSLSELAFRFSHIRVAHIPMDFRSLQIAFAVTLTKLFHLVDRHLPASDTRNSTPDVAKAYSLSSEYDDIVQIKFASYIEAAMPYCCQPQMGCVGPRRTMFQIGILVFFSRQIDGQFAQERVEQTPETMRWFNQRTRVDFTDHSMKDRPLPQWARRIDRDVSVSSMKIT